MSISSYLILRRDLSRFPDMWSQASLSDSHQAAARGFRSLLCFTILAGHKRPKKELKRYPTVNQNSTALAKFGPCTGRQACQIKDTGLSALHAEFL